MVVRQHKELAKEFGLTIGGRVRYLHREGILEDAFVSGWDTELGVVDFTPHQALTQDKKLLPLLYLRAVK